MYSQHLRIIHYLRRPLAIYDIILFMNNKQYLDGQSHKPLMNTKGLVIFSVIYVAVVLLLSFLIYKSTPDRYSMTCSDIGFSDSGNALSCGAMSFPSGNYVATFYGTILNDSDLVVYSDNSEVCRTHIDGSDSYRDITITYTLPVRTSNFRIAFLWDEEQGTAQPLASEDSPLSSISSVYFHSDSPINNDSLLKAAMAFFLLFLIYVFLLIFFIGKISKLQLISFLILLTFSLFSSSPLMTDHLIYGHDLRCHTGRIDGIRNAFMDGQLIPFIIPDAFNGFGVLLFEYPWLFLLIPAFLRLCDVSMVLSYEVFLFFINTATAFVCFFSVRSLLVNISFPRNVSTTDMSGNASVSHHGRLKLTLISLICSLFYTLSTYRLSDVYIRAAMGEMLAMIFLPLLVVGLYHICAGDKNKWWILLIALTGILQSHILSCVLIIPLMILVLLPFMNQLLGEGRWIRLLYAVISFILLNLWYIIPFVKFFLLPLNTEAFTQYWVTNNIVHLKELFLTSVHTGFADDDRFTPSLGLSALVSIIFCVIVLTIRLVSERNARKISQAADVYPDKDKSLAPYLRFNIICLSSAFIFIIVSSELIPWDYLEVHFPHLWKCIHMIQFPYRFLTLAMVCILFSLALSLYELSVSKSPSNCLVPVLALILTVSIIDSETLMDIYSSCNWVTFKTYSGGFVSYTPEDYLPAGINTETFSDQSPLISSGEITEYSKNGTNITFTYSSDEAAAVTLPLNYYPCYRAYLENGDRIALSAWADKRILAMLPSGTHTVTLKVLLSR